MIQFLVALTSLSLALVGFVNVRIGGSVLYPPALFAFVWSGLLAVIFAAGDRFYSLHFETLLLIQFGVLAMSAGGMLGLWSTLHRANEHGADDGTAAQRSRVIHRALDAMLVVVILALPLYWRFTTAAAAETGITNLVVALRVRAITAAESSAGTFASSISNLVYLASFTALAIAYESDGSTRQRIRVAIAVVVAMVYQTLTGGQAGAIGLLNGLVLLTFLRAGAVRLKLVAIYAGTVIAVFATAALTLGKGWVDTRLSVVDNLASVWDVFIWYCVGGVVAFDRVVSNIATIPNSWSVWRFFLDTANRFGADFQVTSIHAAYVQIAHDKDTNVYTMFYPYYAEMGLLGVVIFPLVIGWLVTILFCLARRGSHSAALLYAMAGSALIMSGFAEGFLLGLNYWVKGVVFYCAMYGVASLSTTRNGFAWRTPTQSAS